MPETAGAAIGSGYPNDELSGALGSKLSAAEGSSVTPRTTSQRQASRSFKTRGDGVSDNGYSNS